MDQIFDRLRRPTLAEAVPDLKPIRLPVQEPVAPHSNVRKHDAKGRFVSSTGSTAQKKTRSVKIEAKKKRPANDVPKPHPEPPKRDYPHLDARFFSTPDGQVMIDVDFNRLFVAHIDSKYAEDSGWDRTLESNVKVALFLFNILTEMVEPYLGEDGQLPFNPNPENLLDVPTLAVRGGTENVTRVDLSKTRNRIGVIG